MIYGGHANKFYLKRQGVGKGIMDKKHIISAEKYYCEEFKYLLAQLEEV